MNNNNESLVENYGYVDEYDPEYIDEYNLYFEGYEKRNSTCPRIIKTGNHCLIFA